MMRLGAVLTLALSGAVAATLVGSPAKAPAAAVPERRCLVTPDRSGELETVISRLEVSADPHSCNTLLLAQGHYRLRRRPGELTPTHPGTPERRITIEPAPSNTRPVIISGSLGLRSPSYWDLTGLRFEGTISSTRNPHNGKVVTPGLEPLYIAGGSHWRVLHDIFYGAPGWDFFDLLGISDAVGPDVAPHDGISDTMDHPRGFEVMYDCFHDASDHLDQGLPAAEGDSDHDHAIYVTSRLYNGSHGHAKDSTPARSYLSRNVFLRVHNGGAIKIEAGAVTVDYNTFFSVSDAITAAEIRAVEPGTTIPIRPYPYQPIRGLRADHNLISGLTPAVATPASRERAFYASLFGQQRLAHGTKWRIGPFGNAVWNSERFFNLLLSPDHAYDQVDAATPGRLPQRNPGFARTTCGEDGFRTSNPTLAGFGRWAGDGVSPS